MNDSAFLKSGKFEKLDELLPKLKEEGHRVVMFSQFIFILDIIEDYMRIRGHNFLRLDGTTKSLDRLEISLLNFILLLFPRSRHLIISFGSYFISFYNYAYASVPLLIFYIADLAFN